MALGERGPASRSSIPTGNQQALSVDALGGDRYGIGLDDLTQRGIYRVKAARSEALSAAGRRIIGSGKSPWRSTGRPRSRNSLPRRKPRRGKSFVDASAQAYSVVALAA